MGLRVFIYFTIYLALWPTELPCKKSQLLPWQIQQSSKWDKSLPNSMEETPESFRISFSSSSNYFMLRCSRDRAMATQKFRASWSELSQRFSHLFLAPKWFIAETMPSIHSLSRHILTWLCFTALSKSLGNHLWCGRSLRLSKSISMVRIICHWCTLIRTLEHATLESHKLRAHINISINALSLLTMPKAMLRSQSKNLKTD